MLPQKFSAATTWTTAGVLVPVVAPAPVPTASPRAVAVRAAVARAGRTSLDVITVTVIISDNSSKTVPAEIDHFESSWARPKPRRWLFDVYIPTMEHIVGIYRWCSHP